MAEQEVLREFLVSLGFDIKKDQEKKFSDALFNASLKAKLLGDALEKLAVTTFKALGEVTDKFEKLEYSSRRIGASVGSIQSFTYAASKLGSSVGEASASLEAFGEKLRDNPKGYEFWLAQLGVISRVNGKMRDAGDILQDLGKALAKTAKDNYFLAKSLAAQAGIDENTFRALIDPKFSDTAKERQTIARRMGFDPEKLGKESVGIENAFRKIGMILETLKDRILSSVSGKVLDALEAFGNWMMDNSEPIAKGLENISLWAIECAKGIAQFIAGIAGDQNEWKRFLDNIKTAADYVMQLFKGIKWLIDGANRLFGISSAQAATTAGGNGAGGGYGQGIGGAGGVLGTGAGTGGPGDAAQGIAPGYDISDSEIQKVIREEAEKAGVDPRLLLGIYRGEGRSNYVGDNGTSFGPFQLHLAPRGDAMGDEAMRSGFDPRDPKTIRQQAAFVANVLKKQPGRLSEFHGFSGLWEGSPTRSSSSDAPAPAGSSPIGSGLTTITTKSGRRFVVASEFADNFKGFINDYEAAGGVISGNSGGLSARPGNASYHPLGRAIDVNQIGRNIRAGGVTLPIDVENRLAEKWGLRSGANFSNPDAGHFEVNNAENARAALERMGIASAAPKNNTAKDRSFINYAFGPNAKDAAAATRAAFAAAASRPDSGIKPITPPLGANKLPLGVNAAHVANNDNSKKMTVNAPQNITINGVNDPKEAAMHLQRAGSMMSNKILRDMQGAAQ